MREPTKEELRLLTQVWKGEQWRSSNGWTQKRYFRCMVAAFIGLSLAYWSGVIVWILTKFRYNEIPYKTGQLILLAATVMGTLGVVIMGITHSVLDDIANQMAPLKSCGCVAQEVERDGS